MRARAGSASEASLAADGVSAAGDLSLTNSLVPGDLAVAVGSGNDKVLGAATFLGASIVGADQAAFDTTGLGADYLEGGQHDDVLAGGEAGNTDFDVFNGGSGNDLVIIAIDGEDSARVAEVVAELESEIGFVANAPDATLDTLGLELNGVERVVLFDGRGFGTVAEMEALGISSALAEQLVLADYAMVGVPLLGLEGPSVLFDSAEI